MRTAVFVAMLAVTTSLAAQSAAEHIALGDKEYAGLHVEAALRHYDAAVRADSSNKMRRARVGGFHRFTKICIGTRCFPERLVVFRTFRDRFLVVIERRWDVERCVRPVALGNIALRGLRSSSGREGEKHYCGAYARTHSLSRRFPVSTDSTPTNTE